MAGRARSPALQDFEIFLDNEMAYTPHGRRLQDTTPKPYTKEILHTGMALKKTKLEGRRERGVKLLIKLFSREGF